MKKRKRVESQLQVCWGNFKATIPGHKTTFIEGLLAAIVLVLLTALLMKTK